MSVSSKRDRKRRRKAEREALAARLAEWAHFNADGFLHESASMDEFGPYTPPADPVARNAEWAPSLSTKLRFDVQPSFATVDRHLPFLMFKPV